MDGQNYVIYVIVGWSIIVSVCCNLVLFPKCYFFEQVVTTSKRGRRAKSESDDESEKSESESDAGESGSDVDESDVSIQTSLLL